ncbi:MFS transporter [Streptomyces sp. NPDC059080]|uniref:MFS transporter n=1 Tax=Streptomyces sp. NPDC059080 TaxID=3346718 RepID=UPI0036B88FBD
MTFLPLFFTTLLTMPRKPESSRRATSGESGLTVLRRLPIAWRLLVVVFLFNLFYMPVETALPLFVNGPLAGSGRDLGTVWTMFGVGAIAGALLTNYLRTVPKQTLLVGIIAAWAGAMFGLASAQNVLTASISFFFGGLIYAPFTPIAYSYLQSFLTEEDEQPVITLWSTASALAAPIGLVTAGPLIYFAGGRGGILLSALITLALALAAVRVVGAERASQTND